MESFRIPSVISFGLAKTSLGVGVWFGKIVAVPVETVLAGNSGLTVDMVRDAVELTSAVCDGVGDDCMLGGVAVGAVQETSK